MQKYITGSILTDCPESSPKQQKLINLQGSLMN